MQTIYRNMKFGRIFTLLALCFAPYVAGAQTSDVVVDYNNPKKYYIGGVSVEGNHYFSEQQIIQLTGMQEGMEITVPGEDVSNIVKRLWLQRYFEDVALNVDHLSADGDSAYFKISIMERPRVSRWTFSGVKSGEQKDLKERLNLRRGGEFSEYVETTSSDIIKRFYAEKGFLQTKVDVEKGVYFVLCATQNDEGEYQLNKLLYIGKSRDIDDRLNGYHHKHADILAWCVWLGTGDGVGNG